MIKEFQDQYRWLSNFANVEINYNGYTYPSVEAAYQAQKSDNLYWKEFCTKNEPGLIKKSSRFVPLVPNWEDQKIGIMSDLLRIKFNKEPYKTLLLQTGNKHLQEGNMWNDKFWGVCLKTNKGENFLGKLIMKIREDLLNSK